MEARYRYQELKIAPSLPKRIDRLVHSAVRSTDEQLYQKILKRLTPETQKELEALLMTNDEAEETTSALFDLKSDAGAVSLKSVLAEIVKLERISSLDIPDNHFMDVSRKRLLWW